MTSPALRFHFIGLVVADMPASLAFYRALGLDIPAGDDALPHVEVTLPGGPLLVLDTVGTVRSFDPEWTAPTGGHRAALAFMCADPAAVDKLYGELVAAGHTGHLPPWDAFWGQRYAVVHDPDGNGVDLMAPLPDAAQ
ncbi:VOC family protein [Embleya sp. NPDC050154]|uniref:VOC family protein n=1 Tax=Embleya sp. NPDC050154 TaxID=3363988 RepID=UPI00378BD105